MRTFPIFASSLLACLSLFCAQAYAQEMMTETGEVQARSFADVLGDAKSNMMRDPQVALDFIEEAEILVESGAGPDDRNMALAEIGWLRSEALTRSGYPMRARPVAQAALARFDADAPRNKLYADILVSLGRTNKFAGEYGLALENFLQAYEAFQAIGETRSESIVLQAIASMYRDAHQYDRAIQYYQDAMERHQGDAALDLSAHNNVGNVYRELRQYEDALSSFRSALAVAVQIDSSMLQARILNNIAFLHVDFGDFDAADQSLDQAFALVESDATDWTRYFWGVRAAAAYGRGDFSAARDAIGRAFDGVSPRETTQHFTEYHEVAANIYQAVGAFDLAVPHLQAFKRLDDEARALAANANSTLMTAQFDFAEQNLQIEQLRAAGLEQALALADTRARQRLIISGAIGGLLVLALAGSWLYYRAQRLRQKALERTLYEDPQTGLPTRQAAIRCYDRALTMPSDKIVVSIAFGIERYKDLEAALGFAKLAEIKQALASRLQDQADPEMIANLGSGMMGMILRTDSIVDVFDLLEQIRSDLAKPVNIGELEIDLALTAGVAGGASGDFAVKNAIVAIEQARDEFLPHKVFDEARFAGQARNLTLMSRMIKATENGDMSLHYQPKLHLPSGEYRAAEALVRWTDPERGYITPETFIELAEETGHIREFTLWSIQRMVSDQRDLIEAGHTIQIAVNISGALISDDSFADRALLLADQADGKVCFEITETAAMRNPDVALANLQRWREAGIKLAIDDYGTGLSSLAYLRSLPSHELKLDRAFVQNVAKSQRDRMLVRSTADLAHALGLEMTAEGVESEAGLAVLKMFGCDWAQGFVLSKAVEVGRLARFLDENNGRHTIAGDEIPSRRFGN